MIENIVKRSLSSRVSSLNGLPNMMSSCLTSFFQGWELTREKTEELDFWKQNETEIQKWEIIDYIATPINCGTCSTMARNLTDHWLVLTHAYKTSGEKGQWQQQKQFNLEGMEANDRKWWMWIWESDCGESRRCGRFDGRGQHWRHHGIHPQSGGSCSIIIGWVVR